MNMDLLWKIYLFPYTPGWKKVGPGWKKMGPPLRVNTCSGGPIFFHPGPTFFHPGRTYGQSKSVRENLRS